jgi:hypothetical protein
MTGTPLSKIKTDRPFADPEAAARELLRIYRMKLADGATHTYPGVTNSHFIYESGGSVAEYGAGRDFGFQQKWFRFDDSGTRVFLLPNGEDA